MKHFRVISTAAALVLAVSHTAVTASAEEAGNTAETPVQLTTGSVTTTTLAAVSTTGAATTTTPAAVSTTGAATTTTSADVSTTGAATTTTSAAVSTTGAVTTTTTSTEPPAAPPIELIPVEPVCEHISKTDINGRAVMSIPEGTTADVSIVYSSPEYDEHVYYKTTLEGGYDYSFELEGRDITEDDYRWYTVSVIMKGGIYDLMSDPYSDTFDIPDGNDNPDSFREIKYVFTIDDEVSENTWDISSSTDHVNEVAFHLNYIMSGDVNGDKIVDASDASAVLTEYAMLSTIGTGNFNERQKVSGDVNHDSVINSSDASRILAYYAESLTGRTPSWD